MTDLKNKKLYYVGGVVRDKFLGAKSADIDYCYEGNAIEFARREGLDIIRENKELGTVRVLLDEKEIDIASTRVEYYPRKGHLPRIKELGCPIEEDLKRRDFTINAMAMRTTDEKLIDIYGGREDLQNKVLRVLHDESFIDDPTRILRALKFGVRFRFHLDDNTQKLHDEYLGNINYDMSWHRLKKELIDTFNMNRQRAYDRFVSRGIYKLLGENQVIPNINGSIQELIGEYPCKNIWLVYLGLFNLSNLSLNKSEQNILDWSRRLMYEKPNKNTPFESLLIHRLRIDQCSDL